MLFYSTGNALRTLRKTRIQGGTLVASRPPTRLVAPGSLPGPYPVRSATGPPPGPRSGPAGGTQGRCGAGMWAVARMLFKKWKKKCFDWPLFCFWFEALHLLMWKFKITFFYIARKLLYVLYDFVTCDFWPLAKMNIGIFKFLKKNNSLFHF